MASKLTIAIAGGTGGVGKALAKALVRAGHNIVICSRHPEGDAAKAAGAEVQAVNPEAKVQVCHEHDLAKPGGSIRPNAVMADVVILAYPSPQNHHDIELFTEVFGDLRRLEGVPVIDATNPLGPGMALKPIEGFHSAGEAFAAHLPGAIVYKAFNTIGAQHFGCKVNPPPRMVYCGGRGHGATTPRSKTADEMVERVIRDVGFEPQWAGSLKMAHNLEAMAELWVNMSYGANQAPGCEGGKFAFTLQKL